MGPSQTVIGVDVGRHTIKAAQLLCRRGRPRLFALSVLPRLNAGQGLHGADLLTLQKVLKRQGYHGHRIVIAAPEENLLRAALELPSKVSGAPMEQIVRMELSRLHDVPPNSFEMVHWELRTPDGAKPMTQTLAYGCPHEAANAHLDLFENAGFDVVGMDLRSAAAMRACEPLLSPPPAITAIADLGWHSASVLFACGPLLIYERSLERTSLAELGSKLTEVFGIPQESAHEVFCTIGLAGEEVVETMDRATVHAIRKHLIDHVDRLLEGLRIPLSYANHQFPGAAVKRMLLIGGGAGIPRLAPYIQERFGIEVRAVGPGDLVESPPELLAKARHPALTVAVGLAQFQESR